MKNEKKQNKTLVPTFSWKVSWTGAHMAYYDPPGCVRAIGGKQEQTIKQNKQNMCDTQRNKKPFRNPACVFRRTKTKEINVPIVLSLID